MAANCHCGVAAHQRTPSAASCPFLEWTAAFSEALVLVNRPWFRALREINRQFRLDSSLSWLHICILPWSFLWSLGNSWFWSFESWYSISLGRWITLLLMYFYESVIARMKWKNMSKQFLYNCLKCLHVFGQISQSFATKSLLTLKLLQAKLFIFNLHAHPTHYCSIYSNL